MKLVHRLAVLLALGACVAPPEAPDDALPAKSVDTSAWPDMFPRSMKGYELYGWEQDGDSWFALVTGTNRVKSFDELASSEPRLGEDGYVCVRVVGVDAARELVRRAPGEVMVQGVDVLAARQAELPDGVRPVAPEVLASLRH